MKIILANGTELTPILATGEHRFIQGQNRDTLAFVFPAAESIEALDAAFVPGACESITVVDDAGSEYIHKGYTIRAELKKEPMEVTQATVDTPAVMEERTLVRMAQRTYTESQMASLTDTVDTLVLESLMGGN